ncbi:MAG TPA: hypothetical protein VGM80_15725 [Gaiellaceae bacterium]
MIRRLLVVFTAALMVASTASGASAAPTRALPPVGVLTPGVSLGGVRIGDTMSRVTTLWGTAYKVCPKSQCSRSLVWLYVYPQGEPLGAGVRFGKSGKVTAVFTLGSPSGWKTHEGLLIGQGVSDAYRLYGANLSLSACIGYGAISMRNSSAVTSIYTTGQLVYGFAITAPGTPVCQ